MNQPNVREHDEARDEFLAANEIKVLRIKNSEVLEDIKNDHQNDYKIFDLTQTLSSARRGLSGLPFSF